MSKTRPNITIKPKVTNDVYALLNAQADFPNVPVGTKLKIQNKSPSPVFIHDTDSEDVTAMNDGVGIYYQGWIIETNDNPLGVKATCENSVVTLGVEVIEA